MSSDQNPGYLLYRGDEILPSDMGIVINHEIRIPMKTNQHNGMSFQGLVHVARPRLRAATTKVTSSFGRFGSDGWKDIFCLAAEICTEFVQYMVILEGFSSVKSVNSLECSVVV